MPKTRSASPTAVVYTPVVVLEKADHGPSYFYFIFSVLYFINVCCLDRAESVEYYNENDAQREALLLKGVDNDEYIKGERRLPFFKSESSV